MAEKSAKEGKHEAMKKEGDKGQSSCFFPSLYVCLSLLVQSWHIDLELTTQDQLLPLTDW